MDIKIIAPTPITVNWNSVGGKLREEIENCQEDWQVVNIFAEVYHSHGLYCDIGGEVIWVNIISVNGQEFVGRYFTKGIGRNGGVRPPNSMQTLTEMEKKLGLSPGFLSTDDFLGEEVYDE